MNPLVCQASRRYYILSFPLVDKFDAVNQLTLFVVCSCTQHCQVNAATESYIRKHILPRLFAVMDGKKDNVLDFEEYVCAVALFRIGTTEEKIRVLFLMYEPFKGLHLQKESLRRLLVDATVAIQKEEVPVATLELWILEQIELSECMADMVTLRFSHISHHPFRNLSQRSLS